MSCKRIFFVAGLISFTLNFYEPGNMADARSDGSFPRQGSYAAWQNANILMAHANDWAAKGQINKAIESYQKAIDTYPFDSAYHYNLGNMYLQANDLSHAESSFSKAVSLEPEYFYAWFHLGQTLTGQGRTQEAIQAYRSASKLKLKNEDRQAVEHALYRLGASNLSEEDAQASGKKKKHKKAKHKQADS